LSIGAAFCAFFVSLEVGLGLIIGTVTWPYWLCH